MPALYRKYRPQTFEEVVGQEAVVRTLTNAITQDKVRQAYLFAGPRGTGKTSLARILAKAVNCAHGPTPTPDGTCHACVAIAAGTSLDVIEMDAASQRGIDDIRDIRDRVVLQPVEGQYKVYILDEAHQLTDAAWNALLKLIEEPPPHLMFIFCTTELQKVLPTVRSRCQTFVFHRPRLPELVHNLRVFPHHFTVKKGALPPGKYRKITGKKASAIGFIAASQLAGRPLFYGSYPIPPASDILHELARHKNFGVKTFQAEDEIAAVCAAIGASFTGHIGLTGTSGPGVALKQEAIGLAVMTELPLVIINVQRGGPSTGLPTKTEQADLFQAVWGRNGECPAIVIAPATPAECFSMAIEAVRLAYRYMPPVFYLSDGYLANGAEPWLVPEIDDLPKIEVKFAE